MFCKWCGLESETADVCSWCRKPFSTATAPKAEPLAEPRRADTAAAQPAPRPAPEEDFDPLPPLPAGGPTFGSSPTGPLGSGTTPFADDDDGLIPLPFVAQRRAAELAVAPEPPANEEDLPPLAAPFPTAPAVAAPPAAPIPQAPPPEPPAVIPIAPSPTSPSVPALEAIPIRLRTPGAAAPRIDTGAPQPPARPTATPAEPPSGAPGSGPAPGFSPPPQAPRHGATPAMPANRAAEPPSGGAPVLPAVHGRSPVPLGDLPSDEPAIGAAPGPRPLGGASGADMAPGQIVGRRTDLTGAAAPSVAPGATGGTATLAPTASTVRRWPCRWCGMESDTPETCSWCHREMRAGAAAPAKPSKVTVSGTHAHVKAKGQVRTPVAKAAPAAAAAAGAAPAGAAVAPRNGTNGTAAPVMGTFQAGKSKYYPDQVFDPVSQRHYDADSGQTTDEVIAPVETEYVNEKVQLGIYAGFFLLLLVGVAALGAAFAQTRPGAYFLILGVASFAAGIVLPLLRVVEFSKDDSEDVGWVTGLTVLLGPFAGSMGYGVLGVVRGGDWSPAMVGVLVTSLLLRIALDIASGHPLGHLVPFAKFDGEVMFAQVMPLFTLAGWFAAELFHKPDE